MDEIEVVLDALWTAAKAGNREAQGFLRMFSPWAIRQASGKLGLRVDCTGEFLERCSGGAN